MPYIISGYLFPGICLTGGFNALASQTLPMSSASDFGIEVFRQKLIQGLEFKLMKSGYILCDFSEWFPASNWEQDEENYCKWLDWNNSPPLENLMGKEEERFYKRQNRVLVFNAHLTCLDTALLEAASKGIGENHNLSYGAYANRDPFYLSFKHIDNYDCENLELEFDPTKYHSSSMDSPSWHLLNSYKAEQSLITFSRHDYEATIFQRSFELLDLALKDNSLTTLKILDLITSIRRDYAGKHSESALIKSWSMIEFLIKEKVYSLGLKRQEGKKGRENKFWQPKMLANNNIITEELAEEIDILYSHRNSWAHGLQKPTKNVTYRALKVLETIINLSLHIPILIPVGGRI